MNKVYIIAEAGVNHNGKLSLAKKLIEKASYSGANAIKFQTFIASEEISKHAPKAKYQKKSTSLSQLKMAQKLELNEKDHKSLISFAKKMKIDFISSPFDIKSIILLNKLKLKKIKIPSGEINNLPYLRKLGKLNKEIILSTGMSNLEEIQYALKILVNSGTKKNKISLLHCNTEYPTPINDINLNAMITIKNKFKLEIGYSDHSLLIETPIAAVTLGAKIIEKHFTLNRNMKGPDHKTSLEPDQFKSMVQSIRNTEKILGSYKKKVSNSEKKNIKIVRKSIVAIKKIEKGQKFNEKNIGVKRPGTGISPTKWDKILNTKAKKNYEIDELI